MFEVALAILLLAPGLAVSWSEFLVWRRKAGRRFGMSSWLETAGLKTPFARLSDDRDIAVFRTGGGILLARLIGGAGTLYDLNEDNLPWSIARPGEGTEDIANPLSVVRSRAAEMEKRLGVPVVGCVLVAEDTGFASEPPYGVFRPDIVDSLESVDFLFVEERPSQEAVDKAWKSIDRVSGAKIVRFQEVRGLAFGALLLAAGLLAYLWLMV